MFFSTTTISALMALVGEFVAMPLPAKKNANNHFHYPRTALQVRITQAVPVAAFPEIQVIPEVIWTTEGSTYTNPEYTVTSGISDCGFHCDFVTQGSLWGASSHHVGQADVGKTATRIFVNGNDQTIALDYVIPTPTQVLHDLSPGMVAISQGVSTIVHVDGTVTDTLVMLDNFEPVNAYPTTLGPGGLYSVPS